MLCMVSKQAVVCICLTTILTMSKHVIVRLLWWVFIAVRVGWSRLTTVKTVFYGQRIQSQSLHLLRVHLAQDNLQRAPAAQRQTYRQLSSASPIPNSNNARTLLTDIDLTDEDNPQVPAKVFQSISCSTVPYVCQSPPNSIPFQGLCRWWMFG